MVPDAAQPNDSPARPGLRSEPLWVAALGTYRDCLYNEYLSHLLVGRWQRIDRWARATVAVAATASVLMGWSLWDQRAYRTAWLMTASTAAVLSIGHLSLAVGYRVNRWNTLVQGFVMVRRDLGTILDEVRLGAQVRREELQRLYVQLREMAELIGSRTPTDLLLTRGLKLTARHSADKQVESDWSGFPTSNPA